METPNLDKLENAKGRDQIALCIIYWADPQTASKENIEEAEQAATEYLALCTALAERDARIAELETGIRKIVDEVSSNSGVRNEYQDFDDIYLIFENLFPTKQKAEQK